jgi:hypothetical protein
VSECGVELQALLDLREGMLDGVAAAGLQTHLDTGCADCRSRIEWLATFLPEVRSVTTARSARRPGDAARGFAKSLMRLHRQPVRDAASVPLPALIARRVLDIRGADVAAGFRGAAPAAEGSRLLFEVDTHMIDLWQEQDPPAGFCLMGQAHHRQGAPDAIPLRVAAVGERGFYADAELEGTEFLFEALPAGAYQLRLALRNLEIIVPNVIVGP